MARILPLCISAGGSFTGDLVEVRGGFEGDFFPGIEGVPIVGLISG